MWRLVRCQEPLLPVGPARCEISLSNKASEGGFPDAVFHTHAHIGRLDTERNPY